MKVSLPQRNKLAQSMLWNLFLLTVGAVFFSLGAQAVAAHHGFLTGGKENSRSEEHTSELQSP